MALNDTYAVGSPVDLGWQIGFLCFGIAALVATHGSSDMPEPIEYQRQNRAATARMILMVLSVLAVTGMSAYVAARPQSSSTVIVLVLFAGGLLAVRLGYAALQTENLDRRTRERDRLAGVVAASNAISSTLDIEHLLPRLA